MKIDPSLVDAGHRAGHPTSEIPVVETETMKVALLPDGSAGPVPDQIISTQSISSKTRTVETTTVNAPKPQFLDNETKSLLILQLL
jgi:hypothetical protein